MATTVRATHQVWQCTTRRLYREWEELQETLLGDRLRQPSREEAAVLRQKGLSALDALLQIVTEHVLDFIAPRSQAAQASGNPACAQCMYWTSQGASQNIRALQPKLCHCLVAESAGEHMVLLTHADDVAKG